MEDRWLSVNEIGAYLGKKGADIRTQFEASPYGWSRDAFDDGLQVLMGDYHLSKIRKFSLRGPVSRNFEVAEQ